MNYSCAMQFEGCFETTIGYRGICSKCYKALVRLGIICEGAKFKDFPFWLQELVRCQDNEDHIQARHPMKEFAEEENNYSGTRIKLGNGCFKLRKMNTSTDIRSTNP